MRIVAIICGILVVTASAVLCFVLPARHVISVGDDVAMLRTIDHYCYIQAHLCVIDNNPEHRGHPWSHIAYALGDHWYLLMAHDDRRIKAMCHFEIVSPGYDAPWSHLHELKSFEIPRPSLKYYFAGLAVSLGIGWLLRRRRIVVGLIFGTLFVLAALGNGLVGAAMEIVPLFFICESLGWLAAFVLGATIVRSAPRVGIVEGNAGPGTPVADR